MQRFHRGARLCLAFLVAMLPAGVSAQEATAEGEATPAEQHGLLHDPQDGKFDMSRWLLEHRGGFLPVPIIVSDPAVGYGGGLALAFFRRFVLAGRVDARWANGDIPFYRLPYIDLRGIGAARYQDTRAATLETELRWNVTPRWALIGFVGAGRTWGRRNSFGQAQGQVAKGAGARYLIARVLGLYVGADYAWGPEDETLYMQVGSAWR